MIAAYLRVSTEQQGESGLGLAAQRSAIETWAASTGREVDAWHTDDGVSGSRADRAGLEAAIAELEAAARSTPRGGGQRKGGPLAPALSPAVSLPAETPPTLVVQRLDRLTRSLVQLGELVRRFQRAGIALVVIQEGVDLSTATGQLIANLLVAVAQWEVGMVSTRTKAAKAAARREGRKLGGWPPVPERVVELVKARRAGGATYPAIALELEERGWLNGAGKRYSVVVLRRLVTR